MTSRAKFLLLQPDTQHSRTKLTGKCVRIKKKSYIKMFKEVKWQILWCVKLCLFGFNFFAVR